jgi:hypothetical protein
MSTRARSTALAVGSAVALSAATLWTVLIEARVTVEAPPEWAVGSDFGEFLERWYAWQATTLGKERWALALLCVGLLGVVVSALRIARGGTARRSAAAAIAAGASLWAAVSLAQSASRHAIEQMAASGNQIDAVNSIAFTVDTTAGWMHAGASAVLGLGLLVLAARGGSPTWRGLCAATGASAWVFAWLLFAETDASRYAGLVVGALLLPLWTVFVWLRRTDQPIELRETRVAGAGVALPR